MKSWIDSSFLIAQVFYGILIDFWPFLRYDIEQIVFHVALDDNFIVARYRRTARKFCSEEFRSHFQVNVCGKNKKSLLSIRMECSQWEHTECTETSHDSDTLLLATRCSWDAYFLRSIVFGLLHFEHAFATAFLTLLLIFAGTTGRTIFGGFFVETNFREFSRQMLFQPDFALFVVWIVLTILSRTERVVNGQSISVVKSRCDFCLTSNGIVQLPQYCTVKGYWTPSFGPLRICSGISVMMLLLCWVIRECGVEDFNSNWMAHKTIGTVWRLVFVCRWVSRTEFGNSSCECEIFRWWYRCDTVCMRWNTVWQKKLTRLTATAIRLRLLWS